MDQCWGQLPVPEHNFHRSSDQPHVLVWCGHPNTLMGFSGTGTAVIISRFSTCLGYEENLSTHMHTRTHAHTRTHTHTHTHPHPHPHTRTHARTHTRTHAHTHIHTHTLSIILINVVMNLSPTVDVSIHQLKGINRVIEVSCGVCAGRVQD